MLKEFREFAMKGNVVDLASASSSAGVGAIVTSLVGDVIMRSSVDHRWPRLLNYFTDCRRR